MNFENQQLLDVKQKLLDAKQKMNFENQLLFDVKQKLIFEEQLLIDAKQSSVDANQLPLDARSRIDASIPPPGGGNEGISRPKTWVFALLLICANSSLAISGRRR